MNTVSVIPPSPIDHKKTFRRIGRVADYCPMCREVRPFAVDETSEYTRFLRIPLGHTRRTSLKGTCDVCGLVMPLESETYAALSEDMGDDLYALVRETFPNLSDVRADRLARARRARENPATVTAEDRDALIGEPLRAAAMMIHDIRGRDSVTDQKSKDGCLLTGFFFLVLMGVGLFVENEAWSERLMLFFLIVMLWVGWRALMYRFRRTARAIRKQIYPMLGCSLRDLSPSLPEVEKALEQMREDNVVETHRLDPQKVFNAAAREKGPHNG